MPVPSDPVARGARARGPATAGAAPDAAVPRLLALADQCVQCGLCLPHCPTYGLDRIEAESPRGRIAWLRATASGGLPPTPAGDRHFDHCLGCLRCETVCPAGVEYGEILHLGRTLQAARRPPGGRTRRLLALLHRPRLLAALLGLYRRAWAWLPARWRPLPRPPRPAPAANAGPRPVATAAAGNTPLALFTGCVARTYEGPARQALRTLLRAAGHDVAVPPGQGCCGAAAAHAGLAADAARLGDANRRAFAGHATVFCLASGCHAQLAGGLAGQAAVADPLAWLAAHGEALTFRPANRVVALHLPCTQRDTGGTGAARALLARVPGLEVRLLPDAGCCGAAGLHQLNEPGRAAALRAPLLAAFAASGADTLLSANIGCRLHLTQGTTLPVRHPIEFLAGHLA